MLVSNHPADELAKDLIAQTLIAHTHCYLPVDSSISYRRIEGIGDLGLDAKQGF